MHTYRPAAGSVGGTMQPDCIAQSSKLSVCVRGVLVRAGGSAGSRAPEHPLRPPTPTPPPRGQGTPPLEVAAILGKRGGSGPGAGRGAGGSGRGPARRGGLTAPQPLGATGGRAGAGRTGARRPRRLGEGCARVAWFCQELFGVTCRLLPLPRVPAGLGGGGDGGGGEADGARGGGGATAPGDRRAGAGEGGTPCRRLALPQTVRPTWPPGLPTPPPRASASPPSAK